MLKLSLSTSKVLLSLETKLARLETANGKLAEALEQEENMEAVEQSQTTLDEESKLIEDTVGKISQLKIMKEEIEKRRKGLEGSENQDLVQRVTRVQEQMDRLQSVQPPTNLSTIWTHSTDEAPLSHPSWIFLYLMERYSGGKSFRKHLRPQFTTVGTHQLTR